MKKVFVSLCSVALLFANCSNNELETSFAKGEGGLEVAVSFDEGEPFLLKNALATRAAASPSVVSMSVPPTSWANVKQTHMFLYDANGKIAYSYVMKPNADLVEFQWNNIPEGTYTLALVANINASTDNVATSLDAGITPTIFNAYNTPGFVVNQQMYIDLKKSNLPVGHKWSSAHVGYAEFSEIFTAYAINVVIKEGETTNLTSKPLKLSREVSLMRTRFDITGIPVKENVKFNTALSCIAIQRQPVGFGLKLKDFEGGIFKSPSSDANRIMIAATGENTFLKENPSYGTIVGVDGFTFWRDIKVLPNAAVADRKSADADAAVDRKYYLIISGEVAKGYKYASGEVADKEKQPVYWYATVNGVFLKNNIRLVNITLKSAGYPEIPTEPLKEGGLTISISAPEAWNSVIESEDITV